MKTRLDYVNYNKVFFPSNPQIIKSLESSSISSLLHSDPYDGHPVVVTRVFTKETIKVEITPKTVQDKLCNKIQRDE